MPRHEVNFLWLRKYARIICSLFVPRSSTVCFSKQISNIRAHFPKPKVVHSLYLTYDELTDSWALNSSHQPYKNKMPKQVNDTADLQRVGIRMVRVDTVTFWIRRALSTLLDMNQTFGTMGCMFLVDIVLARYWGRNFIDWELVHSSNT